MNKKEEIIKILEENKLTNIYSPEQQIIKTLEDEKKELEASMKSSRHQEYVRKEMDKIREEGKMQELTVSDTHAIIKEAVERVKDVGKVKVVVTHTPPFTREMMSEEARLALDL